MMKYVLILLPLLAACSPQFYVGVAGNPPSESFPYNSPLGVIRVTDNGFNNTELFCEHVSSIPDGKDKGLNMCGAIWRIK